MELLSVTQMYMEFDVDSYNYHAENTNYWYHFVMAGQLVGD